MTRQIPEGNTLKPLQDTADILRHGFDVWPADSDERRIDDFLRRTRARPVLPRPRPRWIGALFLVAAFLAGAGLTLIVGDAIATGAATAIQSQEFGEW